MRLVKTALLITAAAAALATASTASAQADRYAYGPSTPNSDGTEGYGSYASMQGSSFVDGRRFVSHHNDGRIYPLGFLHRSHKPTDDADSPQRSASTATPSYAAAGATPVAQTTRTW